ncbi:MAG: hypothetical protein JWM08_1033 [Candidatus Angelobacter sp.]|nr:hypothetical protein [Candidatus Angelobacter sp.]
MNANNGSAVTIPFASFRNISCPDDTDNGRRVFAGRMPAKGLLKIGTNENVRGYLVDAEGKKKQRRSDVHRAIYDTIENYPDEFCVLNGGVVIVARAADIDEKTKQLTLKAPSIINGAQTQGVIRDARRDYERAGVEFPNIYVTFELIVTEDEDLIAKTSIARNFQNEVKLVSIVGRLGQLDELEAALKKQLDEDVKLRKSETQRSDDYISTENLVQVMTALIPEKLWHRKDDGVTPNKVYCYSQRAKCLKDFQIVYEGAKDKHHERHEELSELYRFFLDICGQAYSLYDKWKIHQGFQGCGIRSITREGGSVVEVPDGIVFPILAALSAFAVETKRGWRIKEPDGFSDEELVEAAVTSYKEMAQHNPQTMGKSRACYSALYQITSIYRKLLSKHQ